MDFIFSWGTQLWNCRCAEIVLPKALVLNVCPAFKAVSLQGVISIHLRGMSNPEPDR